MLIYKATNLINGKIYIGMTTKTLEHRVKVHKRDSQRLNTYFYQAIRKHGFDNFKWKVIDTAETMEELEEKERYYIKLYNCFDNKDVGYNTQSGGNSLYEITEEHRRQRSERAKGKNNPMYGTVSPMKGKKFTESHKQKISEAIKKAYRPHMYGGTNPSAKKVRNIDTGEVFETMTEASKKYPGISRQSINHNCVGRTKKAGGFRWEYVKDE